MTPTINELPNNHKLIIAIGNLIYDFILLQEIDPIDLIKILKVRIKKINSDTQKFKMINKIVNISIILAILSKYINLVIRFCRNEKMEDDEKSRAIEIIELFNVEGEITNAIGNYFLSLLLEKMNITSFETLKLLCEKNSSLETFSLFKEASIKLKNVLQNKELNLLKFCQYQTILSLNISNFFCQAMKIHAFTQV